ncbi:MAG: DNA pilot protein [Microviridae sp.]|nr:MAG: DNA pilot protein [Microviridae sp.]
MFAAMAPEVAAAGVSAGGTLAGGVLDYFGSRQANRANINATRETNAMSMRAARENMEFQERMSNTAWQRGVQDMRKAGINPLLAFSKGGASQPTGSVPSFQSPQIKSNTEGISRHVSNAADLYSTVMSAAKVKQDIESQRMALDFTKTQTEGAKIENAKKALELKLIAQKVEASTGWWGKFNTYLEVGQPTGELIHSLLSPVASPIGGAVGEHLGRKAVGYITKPKVSSGTPDAVFSSGGSKSYYRKRNR